MTLKEEEINRKEMAKILPNIQIGYIDKDVKEYLNNTISGYPCFSLNLIDNLI